MIRFFTLGIFLSAFPAAAQEYLIGGYTAFIGPEDLYNSSGTRLTDPVQILR